LCNSLGLGWKQKAGVFNPKAPFCSFSEIVMRAIKVARKAFENRLFVEPQAWAPPYQAWQERAQDTRELADLVTDGQAKNLLILIAQTYERLGRAE
jgi:hypothetical protein